MTRLTRKEAQAHAKVLRVYAQEHLANGLEVWRGQPEMIEMARGDARDYRKIAQLLRANQIQKARDLAGGLDTAAREHIPESVWDAMIEHCDYSEEEYEAITKHTLSSLIARRDVLDAQIENATRAHQTSKERND